MTDTNAGGGTQVPPPASSSTPERIRVRTRRRRRKRRRRPVRWVLLAVGALLLVAAGWLIVTGLLARSELNDVRHSATQFKAQVAAGDFGAARTTAEQLRRSAADAHAHTTGPAWAVAAEVPFLGSPVDSVRTIADGADRVSSGAVPTLTAALSGVSSPSNHAAADLQPELQLLPRLARAAVAVDGAVRSVTAAPSHTWLSPVDSARTEVLDDLTPIRSALNAIRAHQPEIRTLLGAQGPQNVLLVFQNDAEIRPTGGIGGTLGVLHAEDGRLSLGAFRSDNALLGVTAAGLHLGPQYTKLYQNAATDIRDANASPDFPTDAQVYAAIWQHKTGQRLTGVAALDPTTLSYLLAAAGPVNMTDGTPVSSSTVVALSQQTLYARYQASSQNNQRKQFLIDLARSVGDHLLSNRSDLGGVGSALRRSANEHRLLFWSRDTQVQRWVAGGALGGALPDDTRPFVGVALTSNSQSKLYYYLHASVDVRSVCTPTRRRVTAKVTLHNRAPADLPHYVEPVDAPAGTDVLYVGMYATRGATFGAVTDNGRSPFRTTGIDQGHPAFLAYVTIPAGGTHVVSFTWTEPVDHRPAVLRLQPMINPMTATSTSTC